MIKLYNEVIMKKMLILMLISFIVGFISGKLPLHQIKNKLFMTKLKSITVIDGDTIHTVKNGEIEKVRLLNIDCHETSYNQRAEFQSQIYKMKLEEIYLRGQDEKMYLEKLLADNNGNIYLKRQGIDKYGRTLGFLYIGKKININQILLENNVCPPYVRQF